MKKIILLGMFVIGFSFMATAQTEGTAQEAPAKSCCKSKTAVASETKSCCKGKTAMADSKSCDHKDGKKTECIKPASNKTSGKATVKASDKAKA